MFKLRHPEQRAGNEVAVRPAYGVKQLRYDPELIADLRKRHDALERAVSALAPQFRVDPSTAALQAQQCSARLHELRQWEAIRLYPVVSRGLSGDAVAERQWVILRFVVNGLAHRLLGSMQELCAARDAAAAESAVMIVLDNLRAYRSRNEADLYPLYTLMDPCRARLRA
jgi:hypothetical protein